MGQPPNTCESCQFQGAKITRETLNMTEMSGPIKGILGSFRLVCCGVLCQAHQVMSMHAPITIRVRLGVFRPALLRSAHPSGSQTKTGLKEKVSGKVWRAERTRRNELATMDLSTTKDICIGRFRMGALEETHMEPENHVGS